MRCDIMDFMEKHNIKNLTGTLMYEDTSLVYFNIVNERLVYVREYDRINNYKYYPVEFRFDDAVHYGDINAYFKHNVVEDGAQDIYEYLKTLGLRYYDLDEIVKRNNGYNHLGFRWVRFKDFGADTWHDIKTQYYPIYK